MVRVSCLTSLVMVLLWLVGRWGRDADYKFRCNAGEKRVRFQSLVNKLTATDSTGAMQLVDARLSQSGLNRAACDDIAGKVLGVVNVHSFIIPDGVLAMLSLEQRLAWLLSARSDMAFNIIKNVIALQQPVDAVVTGNSVCAKRPLFQLQQGFVERLGEATASAQQVCTVRQELQRLGLLGAEESMPVVGIQVWRPLACLITRGLWSDLSLPHGIPKAIVSPQAAASTHCLTTAQDMDWGRLPAYIASSQVALHPRQFRERSDTVRSWAASLGNRDDNMPAADLQVSMELMVSSLEQHADALEALASGMFECTRWGLRRYDLVFLIRCVMLCSNLKSDTALRSSLIASLHVLFRGGLGGEANYFLQVVEDDSFPVPSAATLGHMRFVLDCVFMLHKREFHATHFLKKQDAADDAPPALFFLLDSSPQGNVNWLMIEYFFIPADSLQSVCINAWRLQQLGHLRFEDDLDEDRVAEERALVETLQAVIQHHVLPPVGLGSGRADLQHELHAFLHALFLETGDFQVMRSLGLQTTAVVTDKGTEAGVQRAPSVSLRAFLSFAQGDPFMSDGDAAEGLPDDTFDLKGSLGIHGLQHFINNCTKGIADAMPSFWEEVYPGMNALVNCLKANFFRQRFVASCLTSPAGQAWRAKLEESLEETLVGWRFGSLAACNKALLEYEFPLRRFWDDEKLHFRQQQNNPGLQEPAQEGQHQQPRPHSQKPEGPNVSLASKACKSDFFWSWQRMFSKIANIVAHMINWLQTCPCHDLSSQGWGPRGHELAKRLQMPRQIVHCPMTSFRAAEIACGQFSRWIENMVGLELAEIGGSLQGCAPDERARILADCQAARQHVVFAAQAELTCWERTPRVFCGLSHATESMARAAAMSGYQQWLQMSDEVKAQAHALTRAFCNEGPLHDEVVDFISGTPRQQLPLLMREAGRLLFVPVNEISVERLHAQTHKQLKHAPHAGGVAVSWAHRSPGFLQQLSASSDLLKESAGLCANIYHPLKLLPRLGLAGHPDIVDVVAGTTVETQVGQFELLGSTKTFDKVAKQIVYHLDIPSQFLPSLPAFKKSGGGGGGGGGRAEDSSLQQLQQHLLLEKFRNNHMPGTFYTLKKSDVDDFLVAVILPALSVYDVPKRDDDDDDGDDLSLRQLQCDGEQDGVEVSGDGAAGAA